MQLFVWNVEDVRIVRPHAHVIDGANAAGVRARLLEEMVGPRHTVLDLDEVSAIDTDGLAVLIACLRSARARGSDLKICGLSIQPRIAFDLLKLESIFQVYDDVEEALRACGVSTPTARPELALS